MIERHLTNRGMMKTVVTRPGSLNESEISSQSRQLRIAVGLSLRACLNNGLREKGIDTHQRSSLHGRTISVLGEHKTFHPPGQIFSHGTPSLSRSRRLLPHIFKWKFASSQELISAHVFLSVQE